MHSNAQRVRPVPRNPLPVSRKTQTADLTRIVAIDGPAGAGKSTVARRVAQALGFTFLDSGAMYRAATWWAMDQGVNFDDSEALIKSTRSMAYRVIEEEEGQRIFVGDADVTETIRSPEVTREIHRLDHIPDVRARLVALQRGSSGRGPIVAEGRDMGTVVFPEARCKIFLEASLEERARRRADQLETTGADVDLDELTADMAQRDEQNRTRAVSPLRPAADATHVDTTGKTVDEVVEAIVAIAREVL